MGCNCGRGIKLNSERLKDLGGELMCDYMLHTKQGFNVEQLMNKHIYHILIELGDNYSNMDANFKDMDDLRFEDGKVILPKKQCSLSRENRLILVMVTVAVTN